MTDNAAAVLKHLADKLDVPVQQLWAGLVAYAPFTYYQWQAVLLLSVGVFVACGLLAVYSTYRAFQQDMPWGPLAMIFGAASIVGAVSAADSLGGMADALAAKNAPEAWASKYIVRRLGQ